VSFNGQRQCGRGPETEYFADGLTNEVINLLGGIPSLNMVSPSSVYRFKGRTEDARELGRLLNVGQLVEGSVRRDGHPLRVDWRQILAIQTDTAGRSRRICGCA
jgi:TolB-like protein